MSDLSPTIISTKRQSSLTMTRNIFLLVFFHLVPTAPGQYFSFYCGRKPHQLPTIDNSECASQPVCNQTKYRNIDGSCTNPQHPTWGQSMTPNTRILPADYSDSKGNIRRAVRGGALPSPRQLSSHFFPDRFVPDEYLTYNVLQWGQFVSHDVVLTLNRNTGNGSSPKCCTSDNKVPDRVPKECLSIEVDPKDPFYKKFNVRCLSYIRANIDNGTCVEDSIEQVNFNTAAIDASVVYGSNAIRARGLRSFVSGKLRVQEGKDGHMFPPNAVNPQLPCFNLSSEESCYDTGDIRGNQNTGIVILQIAFLRAHNKVCDILRKLNPQWNDETLYQETRRIIGAFIQLVTYRDFLPIILGREYVQKKGLAVNTHRDCCINYFDHKVNPSTSPEFAACGFRTFHSLVPQKFIFVNKDFEIHSHINLDDWYFRPTILEDEEAFDNSLRGLSNQPQQKQDLYFSDTITNFLFKNQRSFGGDLQSSDIQRGRDFGLPTYNDMRHLCGLKTAEVFQDFEDVMSEESINDLEEFYSDVNDVDLFVGVMMERLIEGTLVGHTTQCIVGEQFSRYKRGDMFFYENCNLISSFTKDQLNKGIRRMSLSWLFCTVGDSLESIQYNAFQKPSSHNPIVPCAVIPSPDFSAWKE